MEGIIKELGIAEEYDKLLAEEILSEEQLDRLAGEVLNTIDELEIIWAKKRHRTRTSGGLGHGTRKSGFSSKVQNPVRLNSCALSPSDTR